MADTPALDQSARTATFESAVGAEIVIDGRHYVNFGGSSYLGLALHPQILQAGIETLQQCGSGVPMPSTHGVATQALRDVELEAARFFGSEAALYLAAGYHAGLAALAAFGKQFQVIFFDELSHYALRDGMAAAGLHGHPFRHCDPDNLAATLRKHVGPGMRPLVLTDGLYSTFGGIAPLRELAHQIAPYNGRLLVDESHSFGVLGTTGRGAVEHSGVDGAWVYRGGSLGKAFGTCGGIIPATAAQVAKLRATPVGLGASVGLPAGAAMCARSLRYVLEHPELLQRLRANVSYMKSGLKRLGIDVGNSVAPIAAFAPAGLSASYVKSRLMAEGIYVYHSTYIGADADGVVRLGIFADHTGEHLDLLLAALRRLL